MPIHGYPGGVITANPVAPTVSSASGVWTTEQQLLNQTAGRWPMAATQISRSLRFNSADTAYLNRTNTNSPTSTTKFTYSVWVKRGALSTEQLLLMPDRISASSSVWDYFGFDTGNTLTYIYDGSLSFTTTAVFRDVSAWYHIVLQYDSTLSATKCWVNNALLNTGSLTLNRATTVNGTARPQNIGRYNNQSGSPEDYFNGYMTEINMIDGLALDPSYFGFNNSDTGVWSPKQYTGTYGTNGFYLNFSDNSGTTSTTLGKDYSGNGNNWTPNNFSVTAGAGNDSLVDSPTSYGTDTGVGGEVRGNYAVYNILKLGSGGTWTVTDGNLAASNTGSSSYSILGSSIGVSSGKWYMEFTATNVGAGANLDIGVLLDGTSYGGSGGSSSSIGQFATGYAYESNGVVYNNNVSGGSYSSFVANDVVQIALDLDNNKLYFGKNGTWQNSGNPAAGTGFIYSVTAGLYFFAIGRASVSTQTGAATANFGQRAFAYTAPSGFKALCTQNLPTPTISNGASYMAATLYTGNGTTTNLVNTVNGASFQPDLVWQKNRSSAANNILVDSVRGGSLYLISNTTGADASAPGYMTFNSNGVSFTSSDIATNQNAQTYIAWQWNAGGSTVTNTSGTISAQVRANTTSGFSIVTYTGNGTGGATIGHGLGVAPSLIIVKSRSIVDGWLVYSSVLGATKYLVLSSTNAAGTLTAAWNDTSPTSSVFSVGTNNAVNQSSATYVAYCFAPVAGYSAFGSYTGNGSTDGPFVYTNFRPEFVMIKCSSAGSTFWVIQDGARSPSNAAPQRLFPNASDAEVATSVGDIDILSNGFKIRNTSGSWNTSAATYIYAAFAESPFKYSLAR